MLRPCQSRLCENHDMIVVTTCVGALSPPNKNPSTGSLASVLRDVPERLTSFLFRPSPRRIVLICALIDLVSFKSRSIQ